jgi:hypothetical protein
MNGGSRPREAGSRQQQAAEPIGTPRALRDVPIGFSLLPASCFPLPPFIAQLRAARAVLGHR